jgi:hypothetical protein
MFTRLPYNYLKPIRTSPACSRAGAILSRAQRDSIFKLWQAYEVEKNQKGDWDVPDLVRFL